MKFQFLFFRKPHDISKAEGQILLIAKYYVDQKPWRRTHPKLDKLAILNPHNFTKSDQR